MALAAQAALLDELMGRHRDAPASSKRSELRWDDPDICKYFICAFCPHDLFVNTRADLGPCSKIHDEEARKSYQKSSRFEKMGYEEDFVRFLQTLLSDVEKRIKRGQARLALSAQNSLSGGGGLSFLKEGKIEMLTQRINELVEQAEELGCEGKVEEAQGIMKLCDQLREERAQLESSSSSSFGGDGSLPQPKEMEVCLICGAFLVVDDAPQRQEEHVNGKQHAGYATARDFIDTWQKKQRGEDPERIARLEKERAEREKEKEEIRRKYDEERAAAEAKEKADKEKRDKERTERDKIREKERADRERDRVDRERERVDREKDREKRRSRDRSHERDRGSRDDRDRSRRKSSRHSRSRSGERRKRSRSRDRSGRSRDRSSRDRDRRSSRDRDRNHRSKDSDSHHSRDKERSSNYKDGKNSSKEKKGDSLEKNTSLREQGGHETSEPMTTDASDVNPLSSSD